MTRRVRDRLRAALIELADNPTPKLGKAVAGEPGVLRVRVGAWRVLYQIEHDKRRVVVVDIGHRSDIYRRR